ncbi:hypothetical protein V494_01361 [Pseudogymnoascus sp. VKM F-4513 (FW-928)]|nr:hypothetical protein V494_01361 [Pseudogymnoascus sp. VKM F-4513 (FW-928)]
MRLNPRDEKWGFTIYRTVYTPDSDAQFRSALDKIKTCYEISLREELRSDISIRSYEMEHGGPARPLFDPAPCDQVESQYGPLVIEDKEVWDGASIEDVRSHFRDAIFHEARKVRRIYYDVQKANTIPATHLAQDPKSSVCLVIDEEVLGWMDRGEALDREEYRRTEEELRGSPGDAGLRRGFYPFRMGRHGFVKGVDADWPPHNKIWEEEENEPSMLGARNGVPEPPRPVSRYKGWRPIGCEELWGWYDDETRDGGRLGR